MAGFLDRQNSDFASLAELVAKRGKKEQLLLPPRSRSFFQPDPETFDIEQRDYYRSQFGLRQARNVMPAHSWFKTIEQNNDDKVRKIAIESVPLLEPQHSGSRIGTLVPLLCTWEKGLIRLYDWRAQTTIEKIKRFAIVNIHGTVNSKLPPKTFQNTQVLKLVKVSDNFRIVYVNEDEDFVFADPPLAVIVVPKNFSFIIRQKVQNVFKEYEVNEVCPAWSVFEFKLFLGDRHGLSAYWVDLVFNGRCMMNDHRLFQIAGLEDRSILHLQVQHGFPIPIEIHTYWGRRYKVPVYSTSTVRELMSTVLVQCHSHQVNRPHVSHQLIDSGCFALKINNEVWTDAALIYHPIHRLARTIAAGSLESESELKREEASGQLIPPNPGINLVNAVQIAIPDKSCFGGSPQYALARVHRYDLACRDSEKADYVEVKLRVAVDKWAVVAMFVHGETSMPLDSFALVWNGTMLSFYDSPREAVTYNLQIRLFPTRFTYDPARVMPKSMKLRVRTISGVDAEVWVNPFDKVSSVLNELRQLGFYETDYAQLWFNDKLCDTDSTLRDCGLTYDSLPCLLFITIPVRLAHYEGKVSSLTLHCQAHVRELKRNFVMPLLNDEHRMQSVSTNNIRIIINGRELGDLDTLTDAAIWPHSTLFIDINYPYRPPLQIQLQDQVMRIEPYGKVTSDVDDFIRTVIPKRVLVVLHELSVWMHADKKHGKHFDPYFGSFLTDKREQRLEERNYRAVRAQTGFDITWTESRYIQSDFR